MSYDSDKLNSGIQLHKEVPPEDRIAAIQKTIGELFNELAEIGVKHQIDVYQAGPAGYGTGASLCLKTGRYETAGAWISSSDNC